MFLKIGILSYGLDIFFFILEKKIVILCLVFAILFNDTGSNHYLLLHIS